MAGHSGRDLMIDFGTSPTQLVGVRTKGFTVTAEPVDVTTDDDGGERILLPDPGLRSAEISVAGITSDEILMAEIMSGVTGRTLKNAVVDLPSTLANPGQVSGSFFVSTFEITGEYQGAVEFSATLMSAGALTYTPSATS